MYDRYSVFWGGNKVGIGHILDLMVLEAFSKPSDPVILSMEILEINE